MFNKFSNMNYRSVAKTMCAALLIATFVVGVAFCFRQDSVPVPGCAFCDIVAGKSPATVIAEDADIIVIEKKPPREPVNCLIIPKKHIKNIKYLDEADPDDAEIVSKIFFMAQKLSKKLPGSQGFELVIHNDFMQSVPHLHAHFKSPHKWNK